MAMTIGQKAQRILRFLFAAQNPRVAAALARYGFTEADLEEGWRLLRALGGRRLLRAMVAAADRGGLQKLDAWENEWFPIIDSALRRHFPAVHARVFLNLSQTEGQEVAVSVQTLIDRMEELADPEGPSGAEGPRALELLARRGVTPDVLAEPKAVLKSFERVLPEPPGPSPEEVQAELERAEEEAWAYFQEWSRIARVAVQNRTLLRQLGFLSERGGSDEDDTVEPAGTGAPAPTVPVTAAPLSAATVTR